MNLKGRLKQLREELQKSQEEVAKEMGIAKSTYGNYEVAKREPSLEVLVKIAEYYDVNIDYLLGLTSERKRNKNSDYTIAVDYIESQNIKIDDIKELIKVIRRFPK